MYLPGGIGLSPGWRLKVMVGVILGIGWSQLWDQIVGSSGQRKSRKECESHNKQSRSFSKRRKGSHPPPPHMGGFPPALNRAALAAFSARAYSHRARRMDRLRDGGLDFCSEP
ncbi:hypothetical protein SRHO_G00003580 [Serrasalmus rhombeus]